MNPDEPVRVLLVGWNDADAFALDDALETALPRVELREARHAPLAQELHDRYDFAAALIDGVIGFVACRGVCDALGEADHPPALTIFRPRAQDHLVRWDLLRAEKKPDAVADLLPRFRDYLAARPQG